MQCGFIVCRSLEHIERLEFKMKPINSFLNNYLNKINFNKGIGFRPGLNFSVWSTNMSKVFNIKGREAHIFWQSIPFVYENQIKQISYNEIRDLVISKK